jgi:HD superfamily phosphohydrolase YqeK
LDRLEKILYLANQVEWNHIVPQVKMRLRVAVDALERQHPRFWDYTNQELLQALEENPGISAIFNAYDELSLAYVIRMVRLQSTQASA